MTLEPVHVEAFRDRLKPGQLLESLFDAIPEVHYFVKDRHSRFISCSETFARNLGAGSVEELIGKTDYDYSADFLAENFVADDKKVMETGEPVLRRVELVPTGDSINWLSTTKVPLYDVNDRIIGLAGISHVIEDSDSLYRDQPGMHSIVTFIAENFRNKLTIADMADVAGVSVSSVERMFRSTFGVTPLMYLRKTRLNAACRLLRENLKNLATISSECGFRDQTNMTRAFRQELNITPLKYRQRYSELSAAG